MFKKPGFQLAWLMAFCLLASQMPSLASEANVHRLKAQEAFVDLRYIQAAYHAAEILKENPSDKSMQFLLIRSMDLMGAGRQQVSDLYQQALKNYPNSSEILAYATGFYRRAGHQRMAQNLSQKFEQTCRYNCSQYRHFMTGSP